MDFQKNRSRLLATLLTSTFIICTSFLLSACTQTVGKSSLPSTSVENGMSRQAFYSLLYKEITQDELLRSIYFPKRTEYDTATVLLETGGEREFSEESHEALVYKAKLKNIANMEISSRQYRQGSNAAQTFWLWQSPGASENEYAPWNSLIADFDRISKENRAAIVFLCEVGLAHLSVNQEDYSIYLYPDEIISESEIALLREKIKLRQRFEPINAISTHDHEGHEIFLCFSDSVSLLMFKNVLAHLSSDNEILNSFVYFDETGTELSLWVNSVSGGMFSIPLNIVTGTMFVLPYYANPALLKQRLGVVTAMIPPPVQNETLRNLDAVTGGEYVFDCRGKRDFKIAISIVCNDSNSAIYVKVI